VHAGFVVSTTTESKLWNSIFDIRPHQSSTLAPTHPPLRNLRQIPSFGIQASMFGHIDPPRRLRCMILASISTESKLRYSECHISPPRRLHRIHLQEIQALQSKLRYSATSILHTGFVTSTYTESKLRNSSFDIWPHQSSTPTSSHPPLRNPSFGIQASIFGHIKPPPPSDFGCIRPAIAFMLYTFVANNRRCSEGESACAE
jgi:hypothetical protein